MRCIICTGESSIETVCATCHARVTACTGLLPQQILPNIGRPTGDVLVDQWGHAHPLEESTLIGRELAGTGIMIIKASVSRSHAHLIRINETWHVRDLGSANGTFVNGVRITNMTPLRHGDALVIGAIGFVFACKVGELSQAHDLGVETLELRENDKPVSLFPEDETTDVGLPRIPLWLVEPGHGGAALLHVGDNIVQLTLIQSELIELLSERMIAEPHQPSQVRGFVRADELTDRLVFDAEEPDHSHVKQLVRRTRRLLEKEGVGDLIESRKGFGYRLRVIPKAMPWQEARRAG